MGNVEMPCGNWPIEIFTVHRMNHSEAMIGAFLEVPRQIVYAYVPTGNGSH
jgi:hypothetical protein